MSAIKHLPSSCVLGDESELPTRYGLAVDGNPVRRILVCRTVHSLGNLIGVTALLGELAERFPGAEVDIITGTGVAADIYRNFSNVERIYQLPRHGLAHPLDYLKTVMSFRRNHYDLAINPARSKSARALVGLARAKFRIDKATTAFEFTDRDAHHFAKSPVYLLRCALQVSQDLLRQPVPKLNIRLDESEIRIGAKVLRNINSNAGRPNQRTIALFTNATGAKRYSEQWWKSFHQNLQDEFVDFNFIEILPASGASQLSFELPTYYSSNIRKIGAVIGAADIFIGADSGIMHLASAVSTPTIGLFSYTNPLDWQPFGESDLVIETNGADIEAVVTKIKPVVDKTMKIADGFYTGSMERGQNTLS